MSVVVMRGKGMRTTGFDLRGEIVDRPCFGYICLDSVKGVQFTYCMYSALLEVLYWKREWICVP